MFEKELKNALTKALEEKGSRKFKQSVDLIINLRNVDFTKPENRLNMDVILLHDIQKQFKIVIFADGVISSEAKKRTPYVFSSDSIEQLKNNKKLLKELVKNGIFLAQPQILPLVAKNLGAVLGKKGKLPKPLGNDIDNSIEQAKRTVKIQTKGKYLPTIMSIIGKEDMEIDKLVENASIIIESIMKKLPSASIKSIYVKLTMGKPIKVV
ncbi:MAG: 50S ribosomal protein L1 [Candidatus Micrarchaeota archaeon]|nr:50S ribosomal protein L1 [Candidatus Micrarchaeota archaeon]